MRNINIELFKNDIFSQNNKAVTIRGTKDQR